MRAKACRRALKGNAGRGRDLLDLRDRHRVTVVCSVFGGEGTERQADANDDSRQDHADSALGFAAGDGKHDGLLGSLLCDVRVIAGLALRHGRALRGYTANEITGESHRDTGETTAGSVAAGAGRPLLPRAVLTSRSTAPVREVGIVAALGLLSGICGKEWVLPGSGLSLASCGCLHGVGQHTINFCPCIPHVGREYGAQPRIERP